MKVRIAVAITKGGRWAAQGFVASDDGEVAAWAYEMLDEEGAAICWVTADVPVPEDTEVVGTVEP